MFPRFFPYIRHINHDLESNNHRLGFPSGFLVHIEQSNLFTFEPLNVLTVKEYNEYKNEKMNKIEFTMIGSRPDQMK